MNHAGTQRIETKRLILRPFMAQDIEPAFRNWCSDDEVTKYLTWPTHRDISVTESVIRDWLSHYGEPDFYLWAIEPRLLGEPVGSISVVHINEHAGRMEVGYCIGKAWWHQGIVSEAYRAVIDYLFTRTDVNRVESRHDSNNPHSGQVMRKCGLTYEGTLRQSDWNNQGVADACWYGILREEYENGAK